jgi:hypothetical protein
LSHRRNTNGFPWPIPPFDPNKPYEVVEPGICRALAGEGTQAANVGANYYWALTSMLSYLAPALNDTRLCLEVPKKATNQQMARVIVRYVEARPEKMHEAFMLLAFEALHEAWPCRNKQR